ncbi:MAG TPA: hypothetical protein EYN66_21985, partial [Myxococcales bacterium]|nr:hypothetical protein [Myxococcales bacterium]
PKHCTAGDTSSLTPIKIQGVQEVVELDTPGNHSCALRANGQVQCWGDVLGFGPAGLTICTTNQSSCNADGSSCTCTTDGEACSKAWKPNAFVPGLSHVVHLAGGTGFQCALRANGTVWC